MTGQMRMKAAAVTAAAAIAIGATVNLAQRGPRARDRQARRTAA